MPTTKLKNILYRCALPFAAPSIPKHPLIASEGTPLHHQSSLEHVLRKNHVSGAAVLLQKGQDQSALFSKAVHCDLQPGAATYFRVASITKTATSMLILRLYEKHVLDLAAPVTNYLPSLSSAEALSSVTLFQLLSHTSGLSDPPDLEQKLNDAVCLSEALQGRRFAEPGSAFRYSNLGFGILGSVLEALFNEPVARIFDRELFQPLSMDATLDASSLPKERILPIVRVLPYRPQNQVVRTPLGRRPQLVADPDHHYGYTAGSLYLTLPALQKMFLALCTPAPSSVPPYLSSETIRFMSSPHASYGALSPTLSYGLGLLIIRDPSLSSGRILGHQGFAYGCVDGAFWEENTHNLLLFLNGGCSEARTGRLGIANRDMLRWAFREESGS